MHLRHLISPVVTAFLLQAAHIAKAQNWSATPAPVLDWTSVAASSDGVRLAGAARLGGIYISTNSARSWKMTSAPKVAWNSIACSFEGKRLIAAANPGPVLLSTNFGTTWFNSQLPTNTWFSVGSSSDGSVLVAAVANGGIYCSTNSGVTWQQAPVPTNKPWSSVASTADGSVLVAVADPGPIYTSTNSGLNWSSNTAPILSWSATVVSADGSKLFAAATGGGIYTSTNLGASWNRTGATNESWFCLACSADGANLLAGALFRGIYTSADSGRNWTKTQAPARGWLSIAMSSDGAVQYAAASGGIFAPGNGLASFSGFLNSTYQGLFFETNGVLVESSGSLTITTKTNGAFTGKLQLAGKSFSYSGKFSEDGISSNAITRTGLTALKVLMQVDSTRSDHITGRISNGTWTSELNAYAAVFSKTNPCPNAGNFTLVFPGNDSPTNEPHGHSYATVSLDPVGKVSASCKFADGSAASIKSTVSHDGFWPFITSLNKGKGLLIGWLVFSNAPSSDVSGLMSWIAPGFTNLLEATGSAYRFTNHIRALNLSTGLVSFANISLGSDTQSISNKILLTTNNQVINLSSNKLTFSIKTASGEFSGNVSVPAIAKPLPFSGVLLQKQNIGAGFYLQQNGSGPAVLEGN